jgi:hypothetical protein
MIRTVTTGHSIADYIRWANQVDKTWKRPLGSFLKEEGGTTHPAELEDEEEPHGFVIAEKWIKAAEDIAESALWAEDLPRFNPWTEIPVKKDSLKEVASWGGRSSDSEKTFTALRRVCKERFGQYAVLQQIRQFFEKVAVEAAPEEPYRRRTRLRFPVFFSLEVNPRKRTSTEILHPPIYQQFLSALEGIDASRIRRCPECHNLFWAARFQHTTCSTKCRKNRSRSRGPLFDAPSKGADK